jgi:hypothetical protein
VLVHGYSEYRTILRRTMRGPWCLQTIMNVGSGINLNHVALVVDSPPMSVLRVRVRCVICITLLTFTAICFMVFRTNYSNQ